MLLSLTASKPDVLCTTSSGHEAPMYDLTLLQSPMLTSDEPATPSANDKLTGPWNKLPVEAKLVSIGGGRQA